MVLTDRETEVERGAGAELSSPSSLQTAGESPKVAWAPGSSSILTAGQVRLVTTRRGEGSRGGEGLFNS